MTYIIAQQTMTAIIQDTPQNRQALCYLSAKLFKLRPAVKQLIDPELDVYAQKPVGRDIDISYGLSVARRNYLFGDVALTQNGNNFELVIPVSGRRPFVTHMLHNTLPVLFDAAFEEASHTVTMTRETCLS